MTQGLTNYPPCWTQDLWIGGKRDLLTQTPGASIVMYFFKHSLIYWYDTAIPGL